MDIQENSIEFYGSDQRMTCTFQTQRFRNKIKSLAEKYPEEVTVIEDADGYTVAHLPLTYLKISAPRKMSEEQKKTMGERLKQINNTRMF